MMRKISIDTIRHDHHRYPTCGDYWTDRDGVEQIRVSFLPDWRMGLLVAVHELIEDALCQYRGIAEPDIAAFDIQFEKDGKDGEPGDDPEAPYRKEHFFSTTMERLLAAELGVDWGEYDRVVLALFEKETLT